MLCQLLKLWNSEAIQVLTGLFDFLTPGVLNTVLPMSVFNGPCSDFAFIVF